MTACAVPGQRPQDAKGALHCPPFTAPEAQMGNAEEKLTLSAADFLAWEAQQTLASAMLTA